MNPVITEQDEDGEWIVSDDSGPELLDELIAGIVNGKQPETDDDAEA